MDQFIVLIVLLVLGVPFVAGIWLIVRAISSRNQIEELNRRVDHLQLELAKLKQQPPAAAKTMEEKIAGFSPATLPERKEEPKPHVPPPIPVHEPPYQPHIELVNEPEAAAPPPKAEPVQPPKPAFVPPIPPLRPLTPPKPAVPVVPKINWEQLLGVKGLAWIGGLTAFLGCALFIQYSFEHNWIPPELRMALGFLTGLALVIGGVVLHRRKQYEVGAQTLCATGVVVLYAVTYACRALYHFEYFGPVLTFLLMVLITTTAFFIAVRLNALVVAILGMLGGFLTPILISTGQDNPLGLFGYIAILDAGLVFVALNRKWHFITALGALGTIFMQIGWAAQFFEAGKYFEGDKIFVALAVLVGFNALYLAGNWLARRRGLSNSWLAGSQLGLAAVALGFTLFFFDYAPLAARPILLFGYVFLIDLSVAALGWLDDRIAPAKPAAGAIVFSLLAIWTSGRLTNELLNTALVFYLVFAVFHSALPAWMQRRRGVTSGATARWNHVFPPLALLLVLVPIFKLEDLSFLVWPFILLVDLLAIVLAALTATLLPVLAVLLLTLGATAMLIFKIPADLTGLPTSFILLGAFAVFFVMASVWLARRFKPDLFKTGLKATDDININSQEMLAALLPASSAVLPFLLLIMATLRLPLANPSPVFGLALLLVVLLLGLARIFSYDWMPLVGLISTFAVECAWHFNHFSNLDPATPGLISPQMLLGWYLLFFAVYAVFPFAFLKKFSGTSFPWAAAALAGPAQFLLIFRLVKVAWPNSVMGLLPAVFAVPALLSLIAVLKTIPAESKPRITQIAWFGGVALFFITLIFPVQFDRQWITIGWALEGAALLWLFHRVPHPGLRLTGVGLLIAAFVRLAFNPAVLEYHAQCTTRIFNVYLYTYGLTTAALYAGMWLLAPPRHMILKANARAILASLGIVLAFLLLNIEIADYFSERGSTLTFQFSGNFARDMTYSIAWGLFALGLLVFGIAKRIPSARYSAMALLCVTLLKLFFHDLAQLPQLYRVGAFVGVAIIAMLASFAYQKFYAVAAAPVETKNEKQI